MQCAQHQACHLLRDLTGVHPLSPYQQYNLKVQVLFIILKDFHRVFHFGFCIAIDSRIFIASSHN